MQNISDFTLEKNTRIKHNASFVVGVDEAGRGPLAGPVVAAATCYRYSDFSIPASVEKEFLFIRDSKTISEKKREALYALIHDYFYVGVGIIYPETIDRVNILQATFLAMKEAVGDVQRVIRSDEACPDNNPYSLVLLIDGNQKIPNSSLLQETVVSGDALVKSIAAASIVAKVTRDTMMNEYDTQYPQYGFKKHKGYGTKLHMEALKTYGPTPIHRLSFAPVAQSLMWFRELGIIPEA